MASKQTSKETYILYFTLGVILFVFICWIYKDYFTYYNIISQQPYGNHPLTKSDSPTLYTWIIHGYIPDHNAGSEWMAHAMNVYLMREENQKVAVITDKTSVKKYDGIPIVPRTDFIESTKLLEFTKLLFTHHVREPNAINTAILTKTPVVLVCHDDGRYKFIKKYKTILPKNLYLIANSEWLKKYYAPLSLPTFVLYPPVYWQDYSVSTTKEFITLINVNLNKGGEVFVKIAKKMPEYRFLGVKGAYNKQYIDTRLNNILYLDSTPEIKNIYSRTGILLMPSKSESWGRTAVEAMSSGIPVIAHPTPGLLESCGNAGIFCDRNDIDSWIKEIRKLKTDSTYYEEKSKACLARSRELDPEPQLANMSKWLSEIKWKE